ncbi:D-3-phosphoglycerate dehydrogenase [Clostridium tetanomorphum]|uniref:Hydroxyacid dehydrogenase n=1 Tax=Clostridium tetanomorphum TaxID=1553 RepID=A0A923J098_CLOTT|nr:NAD(P)-dependent oxidoreductase [Clostridium tetanomorphum]KAJ53920.1 D-isomer-specific 2-hydroxyacid dehydrogenase [Clostridium tetanomorphum DSM 665]MBC2398096.1 hydroxyacid dehydrogenase [Clostridium tetanomorphum]MBP1864665.1 D-3-phosphoglycerate dehydrogenase [Clostridium tetanomorphum]NRS84135.1 D-3-phosphoglycerate dehydrogenase [Clostridium tetanomorphum]NRZ97348.1 D-3-phosphoglycerate dehydrogenase [Clostridium tetanomorphum]
MKIVILESLGISEDQIRTIASDITDKGHELVTYNDRIEDIEILKKRASGADILVLANMPLKEEVIKSVENLKMISVAFTGVDHIDMKACREKNIIVCNAAGYSTSSVAELTYGLIFSVLRNIVPLDKATREGKTKLGFTQNDLSGKTIGIIGTGAIGLKVAQVAKAFDCNILAYSRSEKEEALKLGIKYVSLDELLKNSDVVSIHIPANDETKGLISKEKIALMKSNAIFINTGRGSIVDNKALAKALKEGKIAGAGIDVFDMEPPIPKEYDLLSVSNAVLSPHIGFATEEAMIRRAHIVFENITKWLGGNPQNLI